MTSAAVVRNLAETRKQIAAAKKAHPAGGKAPAKKAAEKPAPEKVAEAEPEKLRWTKDGEPDAKGRAPLHATAANGDPRPVVRS